MDFLLNMASSSIIATNIVIIVHHHLRRPKSLIRFGKSLNERFPAYGEEEAKNALYLSTKVLVGGHYFYVSYWRWDNHFPWSPELPEGLAFCRVKAVLSCVALKPLSKREHPRIVRFSSLYNAYFDKSFAIHSNVCVEQFLQNVL